MTKEEKVIEMLENGWLNTNKEFKDVEEAVEYAIDTLKAGLG